MRQALFLAALISAPAFAQPLEGLVATKEFWSFDKKEVAGKAHEFRFVWTSDAHDTLRTAQKGTIFGLVAGESLIRFDESEKPVRVEVSLYNRGDMGDMPEKEFNALLLKTGAALDAVSGAKPKVIRKDRTSVVRSDGAVWAAPGATYRLEWSKNRDEGGKPEFLTLQILPPGKADEVLRSATEGNADPSAGYKATDHLENTPAGDRWIKDVPMVDQGQKGYCAVATIERVLRHYGLPIDQHQIAQIAGSSAEGGTGYRELVESLKKNAGRLKVRMKPLLEIDEQFLVSLANDYNNAARKTKATPLPNPRANPQSFYSTFRFDRLDGPTLLAGRAKNTSGVKRFERAVADTVDKGWPVIWGVTLGYAPENPALPQTKGGHMRLIIGYNANDHTILYTDSWGRGHERKTMSAADAFAITNGMMTLVP